MSDFNPAAVASLFGVRDSIVALASGVLTPLVTANPNRIMLWICAGSVSLEVGVSSKVTSGIGRNIQALNDLKITFADSPQLVQSGWFGFATGITNVYIMEEFRVSSG